MGRRMAILHVVSGLAAPLLLCVACAIAVGIGADLHAFLQERVKLVLFIATFLSAASWGMMRTLDCCDVEYYYFDKNGGCGWEPLGRLRESEDMQYHLVFGLSSFLLFAGAAAVLFAHEAFSGKYFLFLLACAIVINGLPNLWKTVRSLYYSYLYISARKWGWWLLCFVNIPLYPLNCLVDIFAKKRDWCYRFIYGKARQTEESIGEGGESPFGTRGGRRVVTCCPCVSITTRRKWERRWEEWIPPIGFDISE